MNEELENYKKERVLVTVKREGIDSNKIQGFVLSYSQDLLLLQYVYDFNLDGLMVLRISDITSIETTKTDLFQTQLLKDEGLYSKVDFSKEYEVKDWPTVLSTIGKDYGYIIVEDENPDYPLFLLGVLKEVGDEFVSLLEFSGAANWETEVSQISYDDISSFQAGNNYASVYKRYFERYTLTKPS